MANIALYPGGYKPPHIGHYEAAKEALTQADKVIVFVGPKEREGITQDMSIALWKLYTEKDNIEIRNAKSINIKINHKIKFKLLYDKNRSLQKKIKLEQLKKET